MIRLENVRTHNLKGLSLTLDPGQMTVLCGVSGSGKSSLAIDTVYAEGQRRYLETLSHAARAALDRLPPPEADRVEGLPPAIALRQDEPPGDGRATVGTATDLHDLLAGVFAAAGTPHCPRCGAAMQSYEPADVARSLRKHAEGTRVLIAFPTDHMGGTTADRVESLRAARLTRCVVDGALVRLEDAPDGCELFGVLDRVTVGGTAEGRVAESLDTAMAAGAGAAAVMTEDGGRWAAAVYRDRPACPEGHVEIAPPAAEDLSFRSPRGACEACGGTGLVKAERETPGVPPREPGLDDEDAPAAALPESAAERACAACHGTRLNAVARGVALEQPFGEVLLGRVDAVSLPQLPAEFRYASEAVARRVETLRRVGLGHLTLGRALASLSAGERQRVRLAAVLAAEAVGTLVVLDEPLGGLHPADAAEVAAVVEELHEQGNGVLAVEHTFALLPRADRVIELGPGAGGEGGQIVYDGPPAGLKDADTATGRALREPPSPPPRPSPSPGTVRLRGLTLRNVRDFDLDIPLERLTVVSGRSGAGKTTLLEAVYAACRSRLVPQDDAGDASELERETERSAHAEPAGFDGAEGLDALADVQLVPAVPPTRAGRSCVATHTKAMDDVRKLLASVPEAKARGLTAKHFSFNAAGGGRCRTCQGRGEVDVPMAHLADLRMTCPQCGGGRFEPGIADVKFRRRSVVDMLNMTVDEAVPFFRTEPAIRRRLTPVRDVGLGYVRLGQPLSTLSGGEAQRLHLASHLLPNSRGRVLFLLDEPARGLHPQDAETLLAAVNLLLDVGYTVLAAEHDARFLAAAERVV